jgi:hypothetical protein
VNDGEFYEVAVHTPIDQVDSLRDHTAGQVLMKLASYQSGRPEHPTLIVRWTHTLGLEMVTPLGTYSFVLDSAGEHLVVEQVR